MNLAVIPARGGSKRIPRKNIRSFAGRPMIAWSIEAALASECFNRVLVSTDDEEIAAVARSCGAEVPFLRPASLAGDQAATIPVVQHAVEWQALNGEPATYACCVYATAPLIRTEDILRGLSQLHDEGGDYAFSVAKYPHPIQRALRVSAAGRVEMISSEYASSRSQDLEETYHDAAQFYWGTAAAWLAGLPIFSSNSLPLILPRERVQDIDTPEDWSLAELQFRILASRSR